ncbi:MAG: non-hydrolyzing UDP-N-acetylglucosamine 2-epimerase [Candidatus Thorarchaeota archaeon]
MTDLKLFFTFGTRPEIVKMAPIIHESKTNDIDTFVLHTGQHYSKFMSDSFFEDMGLEQPDKNLNIGSGSHSEQTAKALVGIEKELIAQKPDVVMVQGDTNAVLSAAIAAVKLNIPVGHVEAGLRSYDNRMPEEHNRRLTDHASSFLFAPTENSVKILKEEHVWGKIYMTGNTVIDALEDRIPIARKKQFKLEIQDVDNFALLTLHRAENVDDKQILSGLIEGISSLDDDIIFPAHPRTLSRLKQFDLLKDIESQKKIHIIEPVGYLEFLSLLDKCKFVMTDSGGIQEEVTAPSLNKKAFVLRTSTERPESIESGHVVVVGVDPTEFTRIIREVIETGLSIDRPCPYGKGDAAEKIIDILKENLQN